MFSLKIMKKWVLGQEFDEYVGQESKGKPDGFIEAAKQRKEALDHVLLLWSPGLAKQLFRELSPRWG